MRNATAAILAVPIHALVSLTALLRGSIVARGSIALGGVDPRRRRPRRQPAAATVATRDRSRPLTAAEFATAIATNRRSGGPRDDPVQHADGCRVGRGRAARVQPPTAVSPLGSGTTPYELTVAPSGTGPPGPSTRSPSRPAPGRPAGNPSTRLAPRSSRGARPRQQSRRPTRSGTRVSTDRCSSSRSIGAVDPSSAATAIRLDPPVPGIVEAVRASDRRSESTSLHPDGGRSPNTDYRLIVSGVRDLDGGVAVVSHAFSGTVDRAPASCASARRPDSKAVSRGIRLSVRFTAPMDRGSTRRRSPCWCRWQAHQGHGHLGRGRHGPRVRSGEALLPTRGWSPWWRRPAAPTGARSGEQPIAFGPSSSPLGRSRHGDHLRTVTASSSGGVGRLDWWRQLGGGRDLLPRPHELHPDRRLGHLTGGCSSPGGAASPP